MQQHRIMLRIPHLYSDGSPEEGDIVEPILEAFCNLIALTYSPYKCPNCKLTSAIRPEASFFSSEVQEWNNEANVWSGREANSCNLSSVCLNVHNNCRARRDVSTFEFI